MRTIAQFRRMINGASYAEMHPEINEPNVFSISTLSRGVNSQVQWKLQPKKSGAYVNYNMFLGKAIHEYLQRRMPDGIRECEVSYSLQTQFQPPFDRIILLGHVDYVNFDSSEVLEIKAGLNEGDNRVTPLMIRQCAAYTRILSIQWDRPFSGYILRVNHVLNLYKLTENDIEYGMTEIYNRALECARILSEHGTNDELDLR